MRPCAITGRTPPRPGDTLRRYTQQALSDNWPAEGGTVKVENRTAGAMLERVRERIRALHPADDGQKWLQNQALDVSTSLLHQRWLLIEQQGPTVQPVVLAILVSWIVVIFGSFGFKRPAQRDGDGRLPGVLAGDRRVRVPDHGDGQPARGPAEDPERTDCKARWRI